MPGTFWRAGTRSESGSILGVIRPHLVEYSSANAKAQPRIVGREPIDLARLRALDPQAVSEAHRRYLPEVYRYAYYRTGDASRAEDIAGEVFLRLLEALNAKKGPHTNLRGWLYGTASNLINEYFRIPADREVELQLDQFVADDADASRHAERVERLSAVRAALAQLTPEQQHVLALRLGSGFSVKETAELLGKRPGAVKALQFRALNSLRRHLVDTPRAQ